MDDPTSYMSHRTAEYIMEMTASGYVIIYPQPNQCFVDIDNNEQFERLNDGLNLLCSMGIEVEDTIKPSISGKPDHYHAIVTFPFDLSPYERVAYQAALGSDHRREVLSLIGLRKDIEPTTIFAEKPDQEL